jgi:hypothetical protein
LRFGKRRDRGRRFSVQASVYCGLYLRFGAKTALKLARVKAGLSAFFLGFIGVQAVFGQARTNV